MSGVAYGAALLTAPAPPHRSAILNQHRTAPFGLSGPTVHQAITEADLNSLPMFQPLNPTAHIPQNRVVGYGHPYGLVNPLAGANPH